MSKLKQSSGSDLCFLFIYHWLVDSQVEVSPEPCILIKLCNPSFSFYK